LLSQIIQNGLPSHNFIEAVHWICPGMIPVLTYMFGIVQGMTRASFTFQVLAMGSLYDSATNNKDAYAMAHATGSFITDSCVLIGGILQQKVSSLLSFTFILSVLINFFISLKIG
jgi:hypothetical protein